MIYITFFIVILIDKRGAKRGAKRERERERYEKARTHNDTKNDTHNEKRQAAQPSTGTPPAAHTARTHSARAHHRLEKTGMHTPPHTQRKEGCQHNPAPPHHATPPPTGTHTRARAPRGSAHARTGTHAL